MNRSRTLRRNSIRPHFLYGRVSTVWVIPMVTFPVAENNCKLCLPERLVLSKMTLSCRDACRRLCRTADLACRGKNILTMSLPLMQGQGFYFPRKIATRGAITFCISSTACSHFVLISSRSNQVFHKKMKQSRVPPSQASPSTSICSNNVSYNEKKRIVWGSSEASCGD
jgi:hypothetical protein